MANSNKIKLPKFTLKKNENKDRWQLEKDKSHEVVKTWKRKEDATAGGVLEKAVGKPAGSVKIQKVDGKFQEERTYPGTADPPESKG